MMLEESLLLFNLKPGATLHDVKKAYRKLAKENHPDRFADPDRKKEQESTMARINGAYQMILTNFPFEMKNDTEAAVLTTSKKVSDYSLYKKGVEYFNLYTGDYSYKEKHILEFEMEFLLDKKNILEKARTCFQKILSDYPESDWVFDSEERIQQIDKKINHLENRIEDINSYSPYWTEKGTPYSRRYTERKGKS